MKKLTLMAAVATLALCGCASSAHVDGTPGPSLTFANYTPITLNVASSTVVENYTVQNDPDDVAGQFVIPPSEAIKKYAANRFPQTGTGDGQFTISIEDARVHLNELKQKNEVLSWSGIGQEDQYRVMLRLKVTMMPDQVKASTSTMIRLERTLVMPSSTTLAEREIKQTQFLEKMIADLDTSITKALDDSPGMKR